MQLHESKRQSEPFKARLGAGWTSLPVLDGEQDGFTLAPGTYLVGMSGSAWWRVSNVLHVRLILDGDIRSEAGLRVTATNDAEAGIVARGSVAALAGDRVPEEEPAPRRSFNSTGIIMVPPGEPVRAGMVASVLRDHEIGGLSVQFRDVRLWSVRLLEGSNP